MVMLLNSLAVPAQAAAGYGSYRLWTRQNVFESASARAIHGDRLSQAQFRLLLRSKLSDPSDPLLVNYDRQALGQSGGGHGSCAEPRCGVLPLSLGLGAPGRSLAGHPQHRQQLRPQPRLGGV